MLSLLSLCSLDEVAHYARADLFRLAVNPAPAAPVVYESRDDRCGSRTLTTETERQRGIPNSRVRQEKLSRHF
jgi:hypothetical protein